MNAWKFPIAADPLTGKIVTVENEEDIRQSIYMLLETAKGERINRGNYGASLSRFMFEPVNYTLINEVRAEIISAINENEPRVDIQDVMIMRSAQGSLVVLIKYSHRDSGAGDELTYEFDADM